MSSFLSNDEDEDFDFGSGRTGGSSRLANLFGIDSKASEAGNQSLSYTAPKQPRKDSLKDADKAAALTCIQALAVSTFKLVNGQYASQGKLGIALLGSHQKTIYNLILYKGKQQTVTNAKITPNFTFTVQGSNYANFYDDQKQNWSILFESSDGAVGFAKNVAIAIANSAGANQLNEVVVQDLLPGDGPSLENGDQAEVGYTGWILSNFTFGQMFDENKSKDKPFRIKIGKGQVIKGWESGLIGAKKGGQRLLVIPPKYGYGAQGMDQRIPPNSTLIFKVIVNKIKQNKSGNESRSATPQPSDNDSGSERKPSISAKPRSASVKSVENIRARGESIADQLSTSPKTNKAKIISRMAKMGQPIIPVDGAAFQAVATPAQPSDDSSDEVHETQTDSPLPSNESSPRKTNHAADNSGRTHNHVNQPKFAEAQASYPANAPPQHQQLSVYNSNSFPPQPNMMIGNQLGYGAASNFQPQTIIQPQYIPMQPAQSPTNQMNDSHVAMLLSENRTQNTEIRLGLSKLSDKADYILKEVNEIKSKPSSTSLVPTSNVPTLEPTMLLHSITKMVQENGSLKNELDEKRAKMEAQSEKISELLHRNQKFIERSNDMFERKNDTLQSSIIESQSRIFQLEKDKAKIGEDLKEALLTASSLKEKLNLKVSEVKSISEDEVGRLQAKLEDSEQSILRLEKMLDDERQARENDASQSAKMSENLRSKESNYQELLSDLEQKLQISEREKMEYSNKTNSDDETKAKFSIFEKKLNEKWQRKLDSVCKEADEKSRKTQQTYEELMLKYQEKENQYENMVSNTTEMKERYEKHIHKLQSNSGQSSDAVTEVKKVMNAVYKQLQSSLDADQTYSGEEVIQATLNVIRETTIRYLEQQKSRRESVDENDSEVGVDEVDDQENLSPNKLTEAGSSSVDEDASVKSINTAESDTEVREEQIKEAASQVGLESTPNNEFVEDLDQKECELSSNTQNTTESLPEPESWLDTQVSGDEVNTDQNSEESEVAPPMKSKEYSSQTKFKASPTTPPPLWSDDDEEDDSWMK